VSLVFRDDNAADLLFDFLRPELVLRNPDATPRREAPVSMSGHDDSGCTVDMRICDTRRESATCGLGIRASVFDSPRRPATSLFGNALDLLYPYQYNGFMKPVQFLGDSL
jgi:hypothetical protein